LANYKATIGLNHHRTGHVMVKLAEEYALSKQVDIAMYVLKLDFIAYSLTRSP
jgi:hypothetical protein